jgi:6-phosphogluconolactonase (cycloisomerase 2 family)
MRNRQPSLLQIAVLVVAVGSFLAFYSLRLNAQDSQAENFVYVMTNKNPNNSVIQFLRGDKGQLTRLREVPTDGSGTGATGVDPLGSQDSLVLSGDGHLLLAANAGSNEVSVLMVRNGKLMLRQKVGSGGVFPNSIGLFGDLVYVLNSKGATPHINGFRLNANGFLHPIAGAVVALPAGSTGANDIRFAEDGTKLVVTVAATNQILVFEVGNNGIARPPIAQTSAGASPFGVRFGHNGIAIVSEAAGSASSYRFNPGDMLAVISGAVPDTQLSSCWISLDRSATYAYVSNTGSGTISSYKIARNGDLTLSQAIAANTGGAPIDSSLSRDSKFMYVLDSQAGRLLILRVQGGGLIQVGEVSPLPTSLQGVAAQ